MCELEALYHVCRGFFCFSTSTYGVSCVELPLFHVCFAASISCAQTVETSPCGPWAIITFCQLFMKVNDVYVRFIAQSLPPFAASNNFSWEVCRLYRKQCLDFRRLAAGI